MLRPYSPSAFVCFQYQARILRSYCLLTPGYHRRTLFSTSTSYRHDAIIQSAVPQPPQATPNISKDFRRRLRTRKGRVTRETSRRALDGLKQLGGDANILVLREIGGSAPEEEDSVKPQKTEQVEIPDIAASLDVPSPTSDEVFTRITSLRPKEHDGAGEPQYLAQTKFSKLFMTLANSFTYAQLASYYSFTSHVESTKSTENALGKLKAKTGMKKQLTKQAKWSPGTATSNDQSNSKGMMQARSKGSSVNKGMLIDRILRVSWHLAPQEEIELPGQLELLLHPWQLKLLNHGDDAILNRIIRTRKVTLDVFQQDPHKDGVLRIQADKNTAEYAAQDIEEALKVVVTRHMQLKQWKSSLVQGVIPDMGRLSSFFPSRDLDLITSLSGASVEVAGDNVLVIRGLNTSSVDEAERSLIKLLPLKNYVNYTINRRMLDSVEGAAHLQVCSEASPGLELQYRRFNLARWTLPVHQTASSVSGSGEEMQTTLDKASTTAIRTMPSIARSVVSFVEGSLDDATIKPVSGWSESESRLTAIIGRVLFPPGSKQAGRSINSINSATEENNGAAKGNSTHATRMPFSAHFPGLSKLLTSLSLVHFTRLPQRALRYDFVPAPGQTNMKNVSSLPVLQIHMRAKEHGRDAVLRKITLQFSHHIHDVLLPDKIVDVRFEQYRQLILNSNHNDRNVHDWKNAVIANIGGDERLKAPPLTITIPTCTLTGYPRDAKGTCVVKYLCSGIQVQQIMKGQLDDLNLTCNTMQSSKLDITGFSLRAHYNHDLKTADKKALTGAKLRYFVEKSLALADAVTIASAQTVSTMASVLKPRDKESARRLARLAERQADVAGSGKESVQDVQDLEVRQRVHGEGEKSRHDEDNHV